MVESWWLAASRWRCSAWCSRRCGRAGIAQREWLVLRSGDDSARPASGPRQRNVKPTPFQKV
eukprot:365295-Chlamydomonas_euryale.AAC.3